MNIRFKKEQLIRSSRINSKRTCRLRALTHSLSSSYRVHTAPSVGKTAVRPRHTYLRKEIGK